MGSNGSGPLLLTDVRRVEWDVDLEVPAGVQRRTSSELVPAGEVDLLVAALVRLHFDPGVNPHNGRPAAKLFQVRVATPSLNGGFWWTGPSLKDDGAPRARCVAWSTSVAWDRGEHDDPPE